jgi:hypothetical protein
MRTKARPVGIKLMSFAVAAALAGAGLGGASSAAAAAPKPSVKLVQPTFASIAPDGDATSYPSTWAADATVHWTVAAPAGVCAQSITFQDYDTLGGDDDAILGFATETDTLDPAARSFHAPQYWLDFLRLGYSAVVRITDCHGVTVASNPIHVVLKPGDDLDPAMTYSAGWSVANCTCFPGGTAHRTSTKNASVSFRTATPVDASGVPLVLIMPKGPGRGSAALYIDGVKRATINTYHPGTNVNGTIVYQTVLPGTATHLVKIVNLATPGHPRIDLDATINGG